ncbi:MAG: hypothetical protein HQL50_03430 [Magnetococcales bacterium]|nr:hypothetical protein [Magnetococcales bacterium]
MPFVINSTQQAARRQRERLHVNTGQGTSSLTARVTCENSPENDHYTISERMITAILISARHEEARAAREQMMHPQPDVGRYDADAAWEELPEQDAKSVPEWTIPAHLSEMSFDHAYNG